MGDAGLHFFDEASDFVFAELREDKMLFEGFSDLAVVRGPDA